MVERAISKRAIVGVFGSGTYEHNELAEPLGHLLGSLDVHLLTGAGRGVMTAVSRAFTAVESRTGLTIGIVPSSDMDHPTKPQDGYPNPFIEIPIYTHLPYSAAQGTDSLSRNHINVLSANAVIILPGAAGTAAETELAKRYGKPARHFEDPTRLSEIRSWLVETLDLKAS